MPPIVHLIRNSRFRPYLSQNLHVSGPLVSSSDGHALDARGIIKCRARQELCKTDPSGTAAVHSELCTLDFELFTANSEQDLSELSIYVTPLECTLTKNGLVGSLECSVTNLLDLKFPGIKASWKVGGAEVLWRSTTAVTPLECTVTKNAPVSPLECTLTKLLDLKCPGITLFQKRGGGGLT